MKKDIKREIEVLIDELLEMQKLLLRGVVIDNETTAQALSKTTDLLYWVQRDYKKGVVSSEIEYTTIMDMELIGRSGEEYTKKNEVEEVEEIEEVKKSGFSFIQDEYEVERSENELVQQVIDETKLQEDGTEAKYPNTFRIENEEQSELTKRIIEIKRIEELGKIKRQEDDENREILEEYQDESNEDSTENRGIIKKIFKKISFR